MARLAAGFVAAPGIDPRTVRAMAPPRRRRWLARALVGAALVLGAALALAAGWLASDADLVADRAARVAAGRPTRLAELALASPETVDEVATARLLALAARLRPWRGYAGAPLPVPPPTAAVAHHAMLPATELAEFTAALDALPATATALARDLAQLQAAPWLDAWRSLALLQGERLALAPRADVPAEARRLLRLLAAVPDTPTSRGLRARCGQLERGCADLLVRRTALAGDPALAAAVVALADRLADDRGRAADGEALLLDEGFAAAHTARWRSWRWSALRDAVGSRRGRGPLLAAQLRWAQACDAPFAAPALHALALALTPPVAGCPCGSDAFDPGVAAFLRQAPPWAAEVRLAARARLAAAVAAHLLDGRPLPTDPWAADGTPLRQRATAGRLDAVWSVGPDGRDDAGDGERDEVVTLPTDADSPEENDAAE